MVFRYISPYVAPGDAGRPRYTRVLGFLEFVAIHEIHESYEILVAGPPYAP